MKLKQIGTFLNAYSRALILALTPAFVGLIFLVGTGKDIRCAYVVLLMAIYWMTDVLPLAITAFIPVVLFPLLSVMKADDVAPNYLKDNNFLFIGGLMMALAVEESRLQERFALLILMLMGSNPRWLMFGFQLSTAILSMWMSNTATTAMMLPIVLAVIDELRTINNEQNQKQQENMQKALLLCICYSANIGGIGTLTGTGTNIVLSGQLHTLYPDQTAISFVSWMAFAMPYVVVCLLASWLWLQCLFIGLRRVPDIPNLREMMKQKYKALGPVSFHQGMVLFMFILLVLLWFFRDPQIFPGWGSAWPTQFGHCMVSDATSAMGITVLMFMLPRDAPSWWPGSKQQTNTQNIEMQNSEQKQDEKVDEIVVKREPLMTWHLVKTKFDWGTIMLVGGGYAMAAGVKNSGLSDVLSKELETLTNLPHWLFLLIAITMITFLTEFSSNVATASIFVPIMASLADSASMNPLYYMLPVTVACSFAFMLPVATPPNAIVFSSQMIRVRDMFKAGFVMNLLCIGLSMLMTQTWAWWLFDFGHRPVWAGNTSHTTTMASFTTRMH